MKTLSKEAEALILDSIRDVVAEVAAGKSPTAAVVKVAADRRLPAGYVPLVCQAYNIGRQTQQREANNDILGKTAEFVLADKAAALAELYPSVIDSPQKQAEQTGVDPAYSKPFELPRTKVASGGLWTDKQMPAPYPTDPADDQRRKTAAAQRVKQAREEARLQLAHVKEQFGHKLGQLTSYFSKSAMDRIGWADFEHHACVLCPQEAPAITKYIEQRLDMNKRARREPRDLFRTRDMLDRDAAPFALLEGCVKAAARIKEASAKLAELTPAPAPRPVPPAPPVELNVLGLPAREAPSKEGSFLEFAVGSGLGKGLSDLLSGSGAKPTSQLLNDKLTDLEDPQHDAELRRVQSQAMVTDFLANDPVISGFEPDEVMQAINEISQVSPRASTQPALMRPLLRKRLSAGGIEPFEANEIANLEKTLGTAQRPQMGVLNDHEILG